METNIIQIGNSKEIKAQPRQGWAEAAKRAHKLKDDNLLIPDVLEDETFEDWTW
jgi:antitoxin MazE